MLWNNAPPAWRDLLVMCQEARDQGIWTIEAPRALVDAFTAAVDIPERPARTENWFGREVEIEARSATPKFCGPNGGRLCLGVEVIGV